jgi:hypothetical protein
VTVERAGTWGRLGTGVRFPIGASCEVGKGRPRILGFGSARSYPHGVSRMRVLLHICRWVPLKWVIARDLRVGSEGIFFFFVRLLFTLPVRILHLVSDGSFRMISSPAARNTDLTD